MKQPYYKTNTPKGLQRIAIFVAFVFFYVHILHGALLAATDKGSQNLWQQRKTAQQEMRNQIQASRAPSAEKYTLLAGLPISKLTILPQKTRMESPSNIQLETDHSSILSEQLLNKLPSSLKQIPAKFAQIKEWNIPKDWKESDPFIIHIQDAHDNIEAQKNIRNVLQAMTQNSTEGSKQLPLLVGIEGAQGSFNFETYHSFPDRSIVESFADYFLEKTMITGPEYIGMTHREKNMFSFYGVENKDLYLKHVNAFKNAVKNETQAQNIGKNIQMELSILKTKKLNNALSELIAKKLDYNNNKIDMGKYIEFLAGTEKQKSTESNNLYPNLKLFLTALNLQNKMNFTEVENERKHFIQELSEKLQPAQLNELAQASLSYRLGQISHSQFYNYLKKLCSLSNVELVKWKEMQKYMRYVFISDRIHAEILWTEILALENKKFEQLTTNPTEKEIVQLTRDEILLNKLTHFKLSPEDWKEYQKRQNEIYGIQERLKQVSDNKRTVTTEISASIPLQQLLIPFEQFNEAAISRDLVFTNNLLSQLNKNVQKHAVLITGGFHSKGMTEQLQKKQIAYVVLTPRLGKIESDGADYLNDFRRDATPIEKLFSRERVTLADQSAINPITTGPLFSGVVAALTNGGMPAVLALLGNEQEAQNWAKTHHVQIKIKDAEVRVTLNDDQGEKIEFTVTEKDQPTAFAKLAHHGHSIHFSKSETVNGYASFWSTQILGTLWGRRLVTVIESLSVIAFQIFMAYVGAMISSTVIGQAMWFLFMGMILPISMFFVLHIPRVVVKIIPRAKGEAHSNIEEWKLNGITIDTLQHSDGSTTEVWHHKMKRGQIFGILSLSIFASLAFGLTILLSFNHAVFGYEFIQNNLPALILASIAGTFAHFQFNRFNQSGNIINRNETDVRQQSSVGKNWLMKSGVRAAVILWIEAIIFTLSYFVWGYAIQTIFTDLSVMQQFIVAGFVFSLIHLINSAMFAGISYYIHKKQGGASDNNKTLSRTFKRTLWFSGAMIALGLVWGGLLYGAALQGNVLALIVLSLSYAGFYIAGATHFLSKTDAIGMDQNEKAWTNKKYAIVTTLVVVLEGLGGLFIYLASANPMALAIMAFLVIGANIVAPSLITWLKNDPNTMARHYLGVVVGIITLEVVGGVLVVLASSSIIGLLIMSFLMVGLNLGIAAYAIKKNNKKNPDFWKQNIAQKLFGLGLILGTVIYLSFFVLSLNEGFETLSNLKYTLPLFWIALTYVQITLKEFRSARGSKIEEEIKQDDMKMDSENNDENSDAEILTFPNVNSDENKNEPLLLKTTNGARRLTSVGEFPSNENYLPPLEISVHQKLERSLPSFIFSASSRKEETETFKHNIEKLYAARLIYNGTENQFSKQANNSKLLIEIQHYYNQTQNKNAVILLLGQLGESLIVREGFNGRKTSEQTLQAFNSTLKLIGIKETKGLEEAANQDYNAGKKVSEQIEKPAAKQVNTQNIRVIEWGNGLPAPDYVMNDIITEIQSRGQEDIKSAPLLLLTKGGINSEMLFKNNSLLNTLSNKLREQNGKSEQDIDQFKAAFNRVFSNKNKSEYVINADNQKLGYTFENTYYLDAQALIQSARRLAPIGLKQSKVEIALTDAVLDNWQQSMADLIVQYITPKGIIVATELFTQQAFAKKFVEMQQ